MVSTHTISLFVEDKPGVMMRVAGLFMRRGYNIESLAASKAEREGFSRITLVVRLDSKPVEQVLQQVKKLHPVAAAEELPDERRVDRELLLAKVRVAEGSLERLREVIRRYEGRIAAAGHRSVVVEASAAPHVLDALEAALREFGIDKLCRTGCVALEADSDPSEATAHRLERTAS